LSPVPRTWALVVTDGILPGARIELQGKGVRVGRSPSRAGGQEPLLQPDTHMSRDHFAVVPEGEGWAIHDLGSSNGTKVNGEKVNRRSLNAGDEIRAGHTTFRVEDRSAGDSG
jgi:pSer/pThr/pTyr-binding forkhead associated (FHA) protein